MTVNARLLGDDRRKMLGMSEQQRARPGREHRTGVLARKPAYPVASTSRPNGSSAYSQNTVCRTENPSRRERPSGEQRAEREASRGHDNGGECKRNERSEERECKAECEGRAPA